MDNKGQMGFAGVVIIVVIGFLFLVIGTQIVAQSVTNASYTGTSATIANNLVPFMLLGGLALAGTVAFIAFRNR